ncbi:hypothetical protein [Oceanobacillus indicireducens]|uniref:Uncharacterized protein n=1 Tax=Oceanobacillus indicireducens TaxID=1004261 RepID=A0A917Y332_9BACI|nr:hypothetical protein [Oceanobacillus indicireducens]GGN64443.1 hypothetical protein GCM10007971_32330 [Oceanobacillus indicireducens]
MSKVILTKEQAKAMEELKSEHLTGEVVKIHLNDRWSLGLESLNDLTVDEFAQAYYSEDGYEVEPEYKVGDHVINQEGRVVEILEDGRASFSLGFIDNGKMFKEETPKSCILRHATKEEVWWASHGREPWELKNNDILNDRRENRTVTIDKVIDKFPAEEMTVLFTNGEWEFYNNIVEDSDWRVACFADKRLDVKTNE